MPSEVQDLLEDWSELCEQSEAESGFSNFIWVEPVSGRTPYRVLVNSTTALRDIVNFTFYIYGISYEDIWDLMERMLIGPGSETSEEQLASGSLLTFISFLEIFYSLSDSARELIKSDTRVIFLRRQRIASDARETKMLKNTETKRFLELKYR